MSELDFDISYYNQNIVHRPVILLTLKNFVGQYSEHYVPAALNLPRNATNYFEVFLNFL